MEYCNDAGYFEEKIEQVRIGEGFKLIYLEFDTDYELREATSVLIRHFARTKSYT
jgi:hypothetical protein